MKSIFCWINFYKFFTSYAHIQDTEISIELYCLTQFDARAHVRVCWGRAFAVTDFFFAVCINLANPGLFCQLLTLECFSQFVSSKAWCFLCKL